MDVPERHLSYAERGEQREPKKVRTGQSLAIATDFYTGIWKMVVVFICAFLGWRFLRAWFGTSMERILCPHLEWSTIILLLRFAAIPTI